MKYICGLTLAFICCSALATNSYTIPRTSVVELTEPSSDRIYPMYIKLPRSYRHATEKSYPVVYMVDGAYSFQVMSGATRFPMNSGAMTEAIIVALSYEKGSRGVSSRVRDYTPTKAKSWELETGNAKGHVKFIADTVIPYIEKNYRTQSDNRTFVGNSLGGLFAAYILLNKPELFSNYIIGSPSIWFNNHEILSYRTKPLSQPTKVFIGVGSLEHPAHGEREDMVTGAKKLARKLTQISDENLQVKLHLIDGAKHTTAFPTSVVQGMDWIHGKQ